MADACQSHQFTLIKNLNLLSRFFTKLVAAINQSLQLALDHQTF
jgi:hypothetical protein